MRTTIASAVFAIWLGCFTVATAQLPPEIMVDRYQLRADQLMKAKDPKGALGMMNKIIALHEEHGMTLVKGLYIIYARMALSAGAVGEAIDVLNKYLMEEGKRGSQYREALELLDEAEQSQLWIETRQACTGQPKGAECWMEVTGQPECYVWNQSLQPDEIVTWTGRCYGQWANGEGTLLRVWDGGKKTSQSRGDLLNGKRHGQWFVHSADGNTHEGRYVEGKRHGSWRLRTADGREQQGPYVEGQRHGRWYERLGCGTQWEGNYVNGKKSGQWIMNSPKDGTVHVRLFKNGKLVKK